MSAASVYLSHHQRRQKMTWIGLRSLIISIGYPSGSAFLRTPLKMRRSVAQGEFFNAASTDRQPRLSWHRVPKGTTIKRSSTVRQRPECKLWDPSYLLPISLLPFNQSKKPFHHPLRHTQKRTMRRRTALRLNPGAVRNSLLNHILLRRER